MTFPIPDLLGLDETLEIERSERRPRIEVVRYLSEGTEKRRLGLLEGADRFDFELADPVLERPKRALLGYVGVPRHRFGEPLGLGFLSLKLMA